tara:strand:+ start:808 stop:2061 length:1254 start_codon:yes stop_codon:yes gene_type:complete
MANGNGVSLSSLMQGSAQKWAAKNLAKKTSKQGKKEGVFGALKALFKPVAGFLSKAALASMNIASGGTMTPLLMGLGTAGISKIFDVFGRDVLKLGADPSKIEATGKYGYGKDYAKTIREGLEEDIKKRDPLSPESLLGDVAMSYVSALTPKINPLTGEVTGTELGENVMGAMKGEKGKLTMFGEGFKQDPWRKGARALSGARESVGFDLEDTYDMSFEEGTSLEDRMSATKLYAEDPSLSELHAEGLSDLYAPSEEWGTPKTRTETGVFDESELYDWEGDIEDIGSKTTAYDVQKAQRIAMEQFDPENKQQFSWFDKLKANIGTTSFNLGQGLEEGATYNTGVPYGEEWGVVPKEKDISVERTGGKPIFDWTLGFEQGGQVPEYRGGGTITDYFNEKGVTLGGSNKQSLAEMLGRK